MPGAEIKLYDQNNEIMKFYRLLVLAMVSLAAFGQQDVSDNYTQYVNPFIGTKKMGHTFPGASVSRA